ncbi:hypothetical protein GQ600_15846 [Phytophthora cactorum]|nr:hypothetical protein GQ600_15846 [Phytophthora cactorum]
MICLAEVRGVRSPDSGPSFVPCAGTTIHHAARRELRQQSSTYLMVDLPAGEMAKELKDTAFRMMDIQCYEEYPMLAAKTTIHLSMHMI